MRQGAGDAATEVDISYTETGVSDSVGANDRMLCRRAKVPIPLPDGMKGHDADLEPENQNRPSGQGGTSKADAKTVRTRKPFRRRMKTKKREVKRRKMENGKVKRRAGFLGG